MKAGDLRNRIHIMRPDVMQDELGASITGFILHATVWANVRHLSGSETIKSGLEGSKVKVSIRMRYRTDLTPQMRIVCGGLSYQVHAVMPDVLARKHLDLVCVLVE